MLQALRNYVVVNIKKSARLCLNGLLYNIPIDGSIIQENGLFFAEILEIPDFKASDEWLDKWKKGRNNSIHILNLFSDFL